MVASDHMPDLENPRAQDPVFALHVGGKMEIASRVALNGPEELSLAYTPGVARVCEAIAEDESLAADYTWVSNTVAIVTDGTAVLGLGDIGPKAAMPVMEGKAVLFKQFGGVDAVPICLDTTDVDEIVETVVRLAPSFGGINLEDISAPRCFEIEDRLKQRLDIPVFHDDQHGTAVVVLAALESALRLTGRLTETTRVVISGAGAAGVAVRPHPARGRDPRRRRRRPRRGPALRARRPQRLQARARRDHRRPHRTHRARWPTRWSAPTSSSASPAAPCPRRSSPRWRPTRSSSAWPTRTPRCTPTSPTGTRASSRPAAPTSPTRSTTCSPSPASSAAPSTPAPRAITEGMKLAAADALAAIVGDDLAEDLVIPSPFDPRVGPGVAAAVAEAAAARRPA